MVLGDPCKKVIWPPCPQVENGCPRESGICKSSPYPLLPWEIKEKGRPSLRGRKLQCLVISHWVGFYLGVLVTVQVPRRERCCLKWHIACPGRRLRPRGKMLEVPWTIPRHAKNLWSQVGFGVPGLRIEKRAQASSFLPFPENQMSQSVSPFTKVD